VVIAAFGLTTWRKQLEGSAHFELARRLLLEVYRVRDSVEAVRHPFMESSEAAGSDPDVPWEIAAYEKRWRGVVEAEARLRVCTYEARILWGEDITVVVSELNGAVQSLYLVLAEFADLKREHEAKQALSQEQRELLYGRGQDDPFSERMLSAVEQFEAYVRPHLPRPS
jgi:hypothetical protein